MAKEKITLNISGMTCVNCSGAVEKVTKKMQGVDDAKVSFASSKGEFFIDPALVDRQALVAKVEKLGYGVADDIEELEAKKSKDLRDLKLTFVLSAVLTVIVSILEKVTLLGVFNIWVIFIAATIVQFYCGGRFYKHAFAALKNRNYDMNVLVALGTSAAYGYSSFVVLFPQVFPEHLRYIYFMGSTVIITFILLGKYLEERSKAKATNFLKDLMDLSPERALKIEGDEELEVDAGSLELGDVVLIKSGEKVSADGVVIEGEADVDASMLTGESLPVFKGVGDEVIAGTFLQTGFLKVKVTKTANDNMLANIVSLLGNAQNQKMPIGRFADKVANIFVPAVIFVSIVTFIAWISFGGNTLYAFLAATAVLIISCPCALGLATPIAIVSAVGKGATQGILIKNPEVLEVINSIKYAVFDKTGTLTQGKIEVKKTSTISQEDLGLIALLESRSEHPISKAIVSFVGKENIPTGLEIQDFQTHAGKGISAKVDEKSLHVGSQSFLQEQGIQVDEATQTYFQEALSEGFGAILAAIEKQVVGCFVLQDPLKEESREVVQALKAKGIIPVMLTGDHESTAQSVAKSLDIQKIYAQVLPQEKFRVIQELQKSGKVLFVGDGINDSPSLKQADIGMALSSGSDIAKDAGDIVLINNDLWSVPRSVKLSFMTMRTIKQNLFWAFFYNVIGIPLAAGALYPALGIMLTPMYAGIAMSFSSVTVVLNSLRLKLRKLE